MKNNKKYWLRGNLVSLIIGIIYALFVYYSGNTCNSIGDFCNNNIHTLTIFVTNLFISIDIFYYIISSIINDSFLHLITIWPSMLLIGGIIGWIYGKIKNRGNQVI